MALNEKVLQRYREYLILFEYPFIKQKNNEDIKNIFLKENRVILLSWIATKFIAAYASKLEEAKKCNKIENLLADIIHDNGFCRSVEKEDFVKGILSTDKQVLIFDRIFSILSLLHADNTKTNSFTEDQVYLKHLFMKPTEELKKRVLVDNNLISTMNLPNKMTEKERKLKMEEYRSQIEELEKILEMETKETTTDEQISSSNCTTFSFSEAENIIANMKEDFNKLNDTHINISTDISHNTSCSNTQNLENSVAESSKELNNIIKYLQKKKELTNMRDDNTSVNNISTSNDNEFLPSVLQCFTMSNNIINKAN